MKLWFDSVVLRPYLKREEGQTMAEYGVVLAVVTIGAVAVFGLLSDGITSAIESVIELLTPGGS
jgi:Flp pilus assembly pilin Flp